MCYWSHDPRFFYFPEPSSSKARPVALKSRLSLAFLSFVLFSFFFFQKKSFLTPHLLNKTQRFELLSSSITFVLEGLEVLECLWGDNCQPKGNHIVLYTYQAKTKGVSKNSGDIVSWKPCKLNCFMMTKN